MREDSHFLPISGAVGASLSSLETWARSCSSLLVVSTSSVDAWGREDALETEEGADWAACAPLSRFVSDACCLTFQFVQEGHTVQVEGEDGEDGVATQGGEGCVPAGVARGQIVYWGSVVLGGTTLRAVPAAAAGDDDEGVPAGRMRAGRLVVYSAIGGGFVNVEMQVGEEEEDAEEEQAVADGEMTVVG